MSPGKRKACGNLPNLCNFDSDREEGNSVIKLRKAELVDKCEIPGSFYTPLGSSLNLDSTDVKLRRSPLMFRKFIFQVRSLTSLSPSPPTWHLPQTLDLTRSPGGKP